MLITFSGLDGAGKSTLIEWLRASLEREGRSVAVLHMNDDVGVYAYARWARNRLLRLLGREAPAPQPGADPLDPARPANRSRLRRAIRRVRYAILWSETVRRCIYPIDLLIFTLYRIAFEKLTKRVFIMDRYFYDTLVDFSVRGPSLWNRLLAAFTSTPDVPVLLEVAPERAFGRKGEYTVDYLRRRWTAYQTVLGWVPTCVKLANVDLAQTQATLWRIVMARMPDGDTDNARIRPGERAIAVTPDRILVLDGQTTHALACVRSLGRAGHTVFVASPLRRPLASWSRYCRGHFRLRDETVAGFAALRVWARKQGVRFVLPQRERSCVLCNAERWKWEALGITIGCGPEDMLLGAFDQARTLEIAAACGVRIPPSRLPRSLAECHVAAETIGYGCLLKPRFTDFWDGRRFLPDHGTQYLRDAAALEEKALASRQGGSWPVIQGIVPGQGKGVFALCDRGEPLVWFAHERLRDVRPSGSGSSLRRSIPLDARLKEPAARLLSAMAWHGPAMVEFRDDGISEPCLIQVNGRFWGSLELAVASGVDFPRLWMELLSGAPVQPSSDYETGVTRRWLWGDVKRLLYIAAGPPPGFSDPYPSVAAGLREILGPQPPGTRSETWSAGDRWPAVGEWVQGIGQLLGLLRTRFARKRDRPATPRAVLEAS